jgi:hypothetical protein
LFFFLKTCTHGLLKKNIVDLGYSVITPLNFPRFIIPEIHTFFKKKNQEDEEQGVKETLYEKIVQSCPEVSPDSYMERSLQQNC